MASGKTTVRGPVACGPGGTAVVGTRSGGSRSATRCATSDGVITSVAEFCARWFLTQGGVPTEEIMDSTDRTQAQPRSGE
jgi:hypothetical protein